MVKNFTDYCRHTIIINDWQKKESRTRVITACTEVTADMLDPVPAEQARSES